MTNMRTADDKLRALRLPGRIGISRYRRLTSSIKAAIVVSRSITISRNRSQNGSSRQIEL
jgi:hypothetical protein